MILQLRTVLSQAHGTYSERMWGRSHCRFEILHDWPPPCHNSDVLDVFCLTKEEALSQCKINSRDNLLFHNVFFPFFILAKHLLCD
jgi:hypothetical protein